MKKLKVGQLLGLAFGVLILLILIVGGASQSGLSDLNNKVDSLATERVPKLILLDKWMVALLQSSRHMRNILIYDKEKIPSEISSIHKDAEVRREGFEYFQKNVHSQSGLAIMKEVADIRGRYIVAETELLKLAEERRLEEVRTVLIEKTRPLQVEYINALQKLVDHEVEFATEQGKAAAEAYRHGTILIVVSCLLALVLGTWLAITITRRMTSQLGGEPGEAADVVRLIARGDLSGEIRLVPNDTSSMMLAVSQMQDGLIALVSDIRKVVQAAERGDLGQRIDVANKHGFGQEIGQVLNQLMDVTQTSLEEISRVSTSLAAGDLSQKIQASYPGTFGSTALAVNTTVDVLAHVIDEVREVVNAASLGNFSQRMDGTSKVGYAKTLADLLNNLSSTANQALTDISRVAQSLGAGDLTQQIDQKYPGLFGETAEGINTTVENLRELIGNVANAVDSITTAAKEIASGNSNLSSRTEEQASSLEETASSMEEFTATAQQNTGSAKEANKLAYDASEIAAKGGEVVKASAQTMLEIQESSRKIGDIISVIEGIAFQTNILALNAAVEAARAGEQGKGFAVVATEVRALAQRSADAAKEISGLISDSGEKVERGTRQAQEAGKSIDQIVASIAQVAKIVSGITNASVEQSTGIEQVNRAVAQMDEATQQNAALVEEAAAAAESLEEQAQQLLLQVSQFKISDGKKLSSSKRKLPRQELLRSNRIDRLPFHPLTLTEPGSDDAEWTTS